MLAQAPRATLSNIIDPRDCDFMTSFPISTRGRITHSHATNNLPSMPPNRFPISTKIDMLDSTHSTYQASFSPTTQRSNTTIELAQRQ